MTGKDDLHHLVDELDGDAAREALTLLQNLRLPRVLREAPIDDERATPRRSASSSRKRGGSWPPGTWSATRTSVANLGCDVDDRMDRARSARMATATPTGYCMKCKAHREIKHSQQITIGVRLMIVGKTTETVVVTVDKINAKQTGIKARVEWPNFSRYHPIGPPRAGQTCRR